MKGFSRFSIPCRNTGQSAVGQVDFCYSSVWQTVAEVPGDATVCSYTLRCRGPSGLLRRLFVSIFKRHQFLTLVTMPIENTCSLTSTEMYRTVRIADPGIETTDAACRVCRRWVKECCEDLTVFCCDLPNVLECHPLSWTTLVLGDNCVAQQPFTLMTTQLLLCTILVYFIIFYCRKDNVTIVVFQTATTFLSAVVTDCGDK